MSHTDSTPAASPASLRVLVADSDATAASALAAELTAAGYEVVARAATGAEAVTRALALTPDAVLLDVQMPEGSGVDAAALIARMTPPPAVVLMTGDPNVSLSAEAVRDSAAAAVVAKPAGGAALDATLRCAIARARELAAARVETAAAQRQLAERKLIERAKGILMRRTGTTEQEAYRILQRSSQDKATPMLVLAQAVLDSEPGLAAARR